MKVQLVQSSYWRQWFLIPILMGGGLHCASCTNTETARSVRSNNPVNPATSTPASSSEPALSLVSVQVCGEIMAKPDPKTGQRCQTRDLKLWGTSDPFQAKLLRTEGWARRGQPITHAVFIQSQGCYPNYNDPQPVQWYRADWNIGVKSGTPKVTVTQMRLPDNQVKVFREGRGPAPVLEGCQPVDIAQIERIKERADIRDEETWERKQAAKERLAERKAERERRREANTKE